MINIETPQRFYQFNYKDFDGEVETIIDLKTVIQISLIHKCKCNDEDRIVIFFNASHPPCTIILDKNEVSSEVYNKLITAWTTYKMATEK